MLSIPVKIPNNNDSLDFSFGELAKQANGSIVVSFGGTVVLVTACMSAETKNFNFLPLTIEYKERTYAIGKIPGGFFKREGRPKDEEILSARLIDRSLRPLFPRGLRNDIQIIATALSSDKENDPDILALNGASCALLISDIPFSTPVGAVRVAKVKGEFIINPTYQQREEEDFEIVVSGTQEKIVMIEGGFSQTQESEIVEAVGQAHSVIKEIIKIQLQAKEKIGKQKSEVPLKKINQELLDLAREKIASKLESSYGLSKEEKNVDLDAVRAVLKEQFAENEDVDEQSISDALAEIEKEVVRKKIVKEGLRFDSRGIDEIRALECKVGALPRTHGSAIFTRGQTQALSVITLGTACDEQTVETFQGRKSKHFMLHYWFPPFSVGEARPLRGLSRREIGHGALAEKALISVMPDKEEFPYTIRVVSEVLESNGSSSMATVCAASLSLMDAGVPVKEAVAGVAIGIVTEGEEYKILTDIAGIEDYCGDMDFKVAGTKNGVAAIQMDVKNDGITLIQIEEALEKAKKARGVILAKMIGTLPQARGSVSKYAPKIGIVAIKIEKIGELIGPGGKNIRRLTKTYNVEIDIDDESGRVFIISEDEDNLKRAVSEIENSMKEIEVGQIYEAKVAKLTNFGAFCELVPGKSGLLHVSEISNEFVKDVYQVLKEGDIVKVKVIKVDAQGRIDLSKKQAE